MSVPPITITDQGIIAPSTQDVLAALKQMFRDAFSAQDLNLSETTPQGQLAVSLTAIIQNERDQMIQLMNQIDPQYSRGIWQDAIGELYFLTRQQSTFSVASVLFEGLVGVVVPLGFQIGDQSGNIWQTTGDFIIDTGGSVTGTVQCLVAGVIEAAPDTITNIIVALSGLDRVTNPTAAIAGLDEETRENFEIRRQESVSANAKNTDAATRGAIANLPTVVDVWVKSNPTDTTVNFGSTNYPVTRNSILISVVGGVDYDIAWQALVKAGTGCSFVGNTEVTVYDNDTFVVDPPDYKVKFLRPDSVPVKFKVTIEDIAEMSYQDEQNIKNAILDSLKTGKTRARIAQSIRAAQYIPVVTSATDLSIIGLDVSSDGGTIWKNQIQLGVDEFPLTTAFDITVIGNAIP